MPPTRVSKRFVEPNATAFSSADQTLNAAISNTLVGSVVTVPATLLQIGSVYSCRFSVSKTAAGTASNTIAVEIGTVGGLVDPTIITFALPVGTAVVDKAWFELTFVVRGPLGASCIANASLTMLHNLAATGFATIPVVVMNVTSGAFNSTTAGLKISVACTTALLTVLTFQQVTAELVNL